MTADASDPRPVVYPSLEDNDLDGLVEHPPPVYDVGDASNPTPTEPAPKIQRTRSAGAGDSRGGA